ncbi:MAG: ribosomal protein S18-alanine N-acetyltransferase [Anaerolineae bacterium]
MAAASSAAHLILRYMTNEDILEVYHLDKLAFPTPWPISTYRHELANENSRLFVLEQRGEGSPPVTHRPTGILGRIFRKPPPPPPQPARLLVGYSGMWQITDEAHISTIAVHPDWQGRKLGELLLWNMTRHALQMKAQVLTLEVRVSNDRAQQLYRKYGFEIAGRRKGYYRDNGEDAYLMSLKLTDPAYRAWVIERGHELGHLLHVTDLTRERGV